jgi:hypothetical protein
METLPRPAESGYDADVLKDDADAWLAEHGETDEEGGTV